MVHYPKMSINGCNFFRSILVSFMLQKYDKIFGTIIFLIC